MNLGGSHIRLFPNGIELIMKIHVIFCFMVYKMYCVLNGIQICVLCLIK
jgi:hypothetical protein